MEFMFGKPHKISLAAGGRQPLPKGIYLVLAWPAAVAVLRSEVDGGGAIIASDGAYDVIDTLPKGKTSVADEELAIEQNRMALVVSGVVHTFTVPAFMLNPKAPEQPVAPATAEAAPPAATIETAVTTEAEPSNPAQPPSEGASATPT